MESVAFSLTMIQRNLIAIGSVPKLENKKPRPHLQQDRGVWHMKKPFKT